MIEREKFYVNRVLPVVVRTQLLTAYTVDDIPFQYTAEIVRDESVRRSGSDR